VTTLGCFSSLFLLNNSEGFVETFAADFTPQTSIISHLKDFRAPETYSFDVGRVFALLSRGIGPVIPWCLGRWNKRCRGRLIWFGRLLTAYLSQTNPFFVKNLN
jgi:hypothetical protein